MPSQTFSHTATADAPVKTVWSALDHPKTWEGIGGVDHVYEPEIDQEGHLRGFSFDTIAAGKRYVGKAVPVERVENQRMSWRVTNSEVRGLTVVDLDPRNRTTSITVTLQVESVGMLSSMFFPVIAGAIGNGLRSSVNKFAAGFED